MNETKVLTTTSGAAADWDLPALVHHSHHIAMVEEDRYCLYVTLKDDISAATALKVFSALIETRPNQVLMQGPFTICLFWD